MSRDKAQVHVFLSSSMATAKHMRLRKRLCRTLSKDPLLEVFAIENRASGDTSDEIMLRKIELWADVVLMILEEGLRPGVDRELNLAMRMGRRVVLLTPTGKRSTELAALIDDLKRDGRPFQCEYSNFGELAALARSSLKHDIVDTYRNSQRELFLLRKHVGGLIPDSAKACQSFLRGFFLGATEDAQDDGQPECVATSLLMRKAVSGEGEVLGGDIDPIVKALLPHYRETVRLRWAAIGEASKGSYTAAFRFLRAAQAEADRERLPLWIKRDVVLDLQYMEINRFNQGDRRAHDSVRSFQEQLRSLSGWEYRSPVYYDLYALGHRFLSEAVKTRLTGERTLVIGSNLPVHLDELSEALIAGIWLGSYNILRLVREVLAEVLLHYGFEYEDGRLLCEGVRLLALGGEHRRLGDLLKLHSALVADRARCQLLSTECFSALERESPDMWISRSLLYEYLGDYVPDDDLGNVRPFLQKCYDFDSAKGFHGNVMRQALRALPRFAQRFDAAWIKQLTTPLLSGHPVVAGEAVAALCSVNLAKLPAEDLRQISDQVIAKLGRTIPPRTLSLLIAINEANGDCGLKIAAALLKMWHDKKSVLAIQYFAATDVGVNGQVLVDMAAEIIAAIAKADKDMTKGSPMKFAGVSRWQLLAALVERGAPLSNLGLAEVVERVLTNPHQMSAEKRECLESLLWLMSSAKLTGSSLRDSVAELIQSREAEVLSARGLGSVLSASQEELGLYAAALAGITAGAGFDTLLDRVSGVVTHARLDTRLAAVAALRHVLSSMDNQPLDDAILLFRALIRDAHFEVRHFASHGVSEAFHHRDSSHASIREIAQTLARDPHPLVRAGVSHIAGSWGKEAWVIELLRSAEGDANYQVRHAAHRKLADLEDSGEVRSGLSST